jgi:hypothetical protein
VKTDPKSVLERRKQLLFGIAKAAGGRLAIPHHGGWFTIADLKQRSKRIKRTYSKYAEVLEQDLTYLVSQGHVKWSQLTGPESPEGGLTVGTIETWIVGLTADGLDRAAQYQPAGIAVRFVKWCFTTVWGLIFVFVSGIGLNIIAAWLWDFCLKPLLIAA